ncbi:Probable ubiquinone biosynthesis protein UbiB [Moritella viscosa]|uniref:ubiquinone biosynthesis regulatory protein kinase UbiB n=1 Tax=Moritella viscosa TaxID=80854 RepID=UPI0005092577|nr:ubiquinone biosynthesis regulatory protein kinase UbiB [Moritella viscosa]CED58069.1 probable ubiquinone biosynthesis protein UbiB [Moritella viscosa]SHO09355.1 Probable ubiquinone biosynthesis protein UbiB [Moritella viscosa]SHO22372.1 Probable ubiquinone biosynthesis protein UbiB [Moritella viscosa]
MTLVELKRFYHIQKVVLEYGIDELLPAQLQPLSARLFRKSIFWIKNQHSEKSPAERIKLTLQQLGPVFIKFGQMLSTRRDLLPQEFAEQLAMLQDQVPPFDSQLAMQQIESALGQSIDDVFDNFDPVPLASASIAQVHTAKLKSNGEDVVIKIIRPDIEPIIRADTQLMKRLSKVLLKLVPEVTRLRPLEVVLDYEKTILDELNLEREAANAIQLRRNFLDSKELYVPEIYPDFSHKNMIVMERIYGIPVSDIAALEAQGTNMKLLAERGVETFFTQVFRDSFFHADMHPGNVFVSYETPEDPRWIGIDCGIVGTLNREDKRYLAENLLAFFHRDYRKVAELHVDSGWVPSYVDVNDFEFAIRTVCDPIFEKPLAEISFGHVLVNLFATARKFDMTVQPQLVLLQKTLLYIEGLGRQLYPQLDLWDTAKPFLENWVKEQMGPQAVFSAVKQRAPFWAEKLPELPELVFDTLTKATKQQAKLDTLFTQAERFTQQQAYANKGRYLLSCGGVLMICAAIVYNPDTTSLATTLASIGSGLLIVGWCKLR